MATITVITRHLQLNQMPVRLYSAHHTWMSSVVLMRMVTGIPMMAMHSMMTHISGLMQMVMDTPPTSMIQENLTHTGASIISTITQPNGMTPMVTGTVTTTQTLHGLPFALLHGQDN